MLSLDQAILSERLQLLHEFRYSDLNMAYHGSGLLSHNSKNARSEIRILDTIAALLTTGRPGDVTAVALDKRGELQLVLAKNDPLTFADDLAVQDLISVLTNPATIDTEHLFPFLMTNCLPNIHKRLRNLHESLSQFRPDICSVLPQYVLQSIENELPGSTAYRSLMYSDEEPALTTMIADLFDFCTVQSKYSLNPGDVDASHTKYGDLYLAANALSRSRILNQLIRDPSDPAREARAEKLKRRLLKVCQYYGDIGEVIKTCEAMVSERQNSLPLGQCHQR
jgi:hypothetical protein